MSITHSALVGHAIDPNGSFGAGGIGPMCHPVLAPSRVVNTFSPPTATHRSASRQVAASGPLVMEPAARRSFHMSPPLVEASVRSLEITKQVGNAAQDTPFALRLVTPSGVFHRSPPVVDRPMNSIPAPRHRPLPLPVGQVTTSCFGTALTWSQCRPVVSDPYHDAALPTATHLVPPQSSAMRSTEPVGRFVHTPPERLVVRTTGPAPVRPTHVLAAGQESETTERSLGRVTAFCQVVHGEEIEITRPASSAAVQVVWLSHAIELSVEVLGRAICVPAAPFSSTGLLDPTIRQTPSAGHASDLYPPDIELAPSAENVCPWSVDCQMPPPVPAITHAAVGWHAMAVATLVLAPPGPVAAGSSFGSAHVRPESMLR